MMAADFLRVPTPPVSSSGLSRGPKVQHTRTTIAERVVAECTFYVYILASQVRGTLYIGVTNSLLFRVALHRAGEGGAFTRKYHVKRLVWFEEYEQAEEAIAREKSLKRYLRDWKINLIERDNPHWQDLYPSLAAKYGVPMGSDL
jgi:putative endonuclease